MDKPKLLIVDDVEDIRTQMKWALSEDYEVFEAEARPSAMLLYEEHGMPLVALDLGLPPDSNGVEEGFLILDEILQQQGGTPMSKGDPFRATTILLGSLLDTTATP